MKTKGSERSWRSKVRERTGWAVLVIFSMLGSGCSTSPKIEPPPVVFQGPSVAKLNDGRQGFIIRESPVMDVELHGKFERAGDLMKDGKNEQAIELLTEVIKGTPDVTAPHINIAVAYMRSGRPEPAEEHLKAALDLVPGHPVASNEYGLLLRKGGRFKEAREVYERSLKSFPDYLPIHRNLGILCDLYLNDPECALRQFELYSDEMPADAQAKMWIAELRIRLGRQ